MSIDLISLAIVVAMALLLLIGMPLAFTTGLVATVLCLAFYGFDSLALLASRTYGLLNTFALLAVPMFVLMASILERSGIATDLYNAMRVWAGRLKGGVAVQTLVVAVFLAAMTGIIGGEIILLGLIALPQMLRLGYDRKIAIGVVCAGGSLGTMIPPSIVLVIYGLTANVSIGDLFLAVILPGLLLAAIYVAYVLIRCHLKPELGPPAPAAETDVPLLTKLALLKGVVLPVLVAGGVLGSIYLGIASITEAAGVGVIGVMLAAALRGELSWPMLRAALHQTAITCGIMLWLTFGANALVGVYNLLGGLTFMRTLIGELPLPPLAIVGVMLAILFMLGMFMEWIGICLLTMPIFVPVVSAMGYDPVWFGILFCITMQISYITPPFAPAAFYLKSVAPPEITLEEIFRANAPFIGLQVLGLVLVLLLPELTQWLPSLAYR